jgi:hypothetical protein
MITRTLFLALALFTLGEAAAQVSINAQGEEPDPSAGLEVKFTDKGFLPPRLTSSQISAISNPATGLMVFNLATNRPVFFNGSSWRNLDGTQSWLSCGDPLTVNHIAGPVAPVSKNITYGTIDSIPGEPSKCWITSNLGADHQAVSKDDATEASAGWYWQYNRMRGYKHDGVTRTPNTWITDNFENTNWLTANDPCALELGTGWRIPTITEWTNVKAGGGWTGWNETWDSPLKLHAAGALWIFSGDISFRSIWGYYWSSSDGYAYLAYELSFATGYIATDWNDKRHGDSVRCLREDLP